MIYDLRLILYKIRKQFDFIKIWLDIRRKVLKIYAPFLVKCFKIYEKISSLSLIKNLFSRGLNNNNVNFTVFLNQIKFCHKTATPIIGDKFM